jgi:hypothetical protein
MSGPSRIQPFRSRWEFLNGGMRLTEETKAGLNTLLYEADLLGLEINPDRQIGAATFKLLALPEVGPARCVPKTSTAILRMKFSEGQVALKRYRSHLMMLIGDESQSYPSYRDIDTPT